MWPSQDGPWFSGPPEFPPWSLNPLHHILAGFTLLLTSSLTLHLGPVAKAFSFISLPSWLLPLWFQNSSSQPLLRLGVSLTPLFWKLDLCLDHLLGISYLILALPTHCPTSPPACLSHTTQSSNHACSWTHHCHSLHLLRCPHPLSPRVQPIPSTGLLDLQPTCWVSPATPAPNSCTGLIQAIKSQLLSRVPHSPPVRKYMTSCESWINTGKELKECKSRRGSGKNPEQYNLKFDN